MRITESLESALGSAHDLALNSHHEFITPEHILMSLLDDETTRNALVAVGCDTELLAADLTDFFNTEIHSYPDSEVTPEYSEQAQFLLEFSAMHVQMSGKEELSGLHILAAIFRLGESNAVYFLEKQNITRFDIVRYISHGIGKNKEANTESASTSTNSENDPLKAYCIDLTQKARDGEIDPMIGRDRELERVIHILARRRKNNPVLVGDAGVGKTSIIEGLATAIVEEQVPQFLLKKTIMTLNMAALMGGTRFRGDFEERMDALLKKLEDNTDVILFIDEIHTIIGAGAASGGSLDASNLLKPALANGRLRCVGATTWKEYNMIFEKDMALSRRFQKVEVNEPDEEDAYKILDGLKPRYEKFHSVQYAPASLRSAVALSRRYISDRRLPDKAIDLMDEAGAGARVAGQLNRRITSTDMEKLISRITGIPTSSMKTSEKKAILNLEEQLKKRIFGQDAAITAVSAALETSRAGLQSPDKPDGVFLFAGPTGTGKTELSKSLAEILGIEFIRFDMSEYMERHAVSRLIGSPPGYIGYEQGGQLTDAVKKHPHCIILFDEIEKAHEDLQNILLQIMDYGSLTDNSGYKADFRNTIIILTTNSGARESQARMLGFSRDEFEDKSDKALERFFAPEFRNRLTAVIKFSAIAGENVIRIVEKTLDALRSRLTEQKISLSAEKEALQWLADHGYDAKMGARPLERIVDQQVARKIARMILAGEVKKGDSLRLKLNGNELELQVLDS